MFVTGVCHFTSVVLLSLSSILLSFVIPCHCPLCSCHHHLSPSLVTPRRFREFVALDEKLQQFYGSLRTTLPPRKTVGNMNKEFLEKRRAQLEKYLVVRQDVCVLCAVPSTLHACTHIRTTTHKHTHTISSPFLCVIASGPGDERRHK